MAQSASARPGFSLFDAARRLTEEPNFDRIVMVVVLANAVVLGASTYDSFANRYAGLIDALNNAFLVVFVVELAIRFVGCRMNPRRFFSNGWNVFDFIVIGAALVPGLRANTTLLRLARLLRVVRAVRLLPDLRVLVVAVGRALPAVGSLAILTFLLLFVYGMIGWLIFNQHDPERFGNVGEAMLNLFVMLTLENLPENLEMGRQLSEWTLLYFISFALLAAFLLFNLFVGIVINSMEEARAIELKRAKEQLADDDDLNDEQAQAVVIVDHVRALRSSLDDLERQLEESGALNVGKQAFGPVPSGGARAGKPARRPKES